jgi:hypothetical protein
MDLKETEWGLWTRFIISGEGPVVGSVTVPLHITLYAGFGRTVNSFSGLCHGDNSDNGKLHL